MIKKNIIGILILWCLSVTAQDKKVAVFDPAGNVDISIKEIIREEISSIIVNTNGYTVLERQLINKVLEENKFQMGGLVDDSQVSEIGKRMGANLVFVTNVTPLNGNYYISCKMIEVQTARIEKQKTVQTTRGASDLITTVQKAVKEMFVQSVNTGQSDVSKPNETLTVDGIKVYLNGKQLTKYEVKNKMVINDNALRLYDKGISQYKIGNILLISGASLIVTGVILGLTIPAERYVYEDGSVNVQHVTQRLAGISVGGPGLVSSISGLILRSKGKKNVGEAVYTYNQRNYTSQVKLGFGASPNGVKLTVNF
jgi:hypothetical protein